MQYAGGVDVGSTQTKAVVIDHARRIVGRSLIMTGANVVTAAQEAFQAALDDAVVREADIGYVIGTGYGRYKVTFGNDQVTEISCHARGAAHLFTVRVPGKRCAPCSTWAARTPRPSGSARTATSSISA